MCVCCWQVDALEREREAHREEIEEGKGISRQVAMLDSRVSAMLSRLRSELEEADSKIGEAFHSLDLDGDGIVSHDELLKVRPIAGGPQSLIPLSL